MICAAAIIALTCTAQIHVRGEEATIDDPIVKLSSAGVEVGGDQPRIMGWQRVRSVDGEYQAQAQVFAALADDLWRGGIRLSRGDAPGALPLFERSFSRRDWESGPTWLFATEGLAQCRLKLGDTAGAVRPWLVALQLQRRGLALDPDERGHPILEIDGETGLNPVLAPMWVSSPELSEIAALAPASFMADADPAVHALFVLYRRAAQFELGLGGVNVTAEIDPRARELPGIRLVEQIVQSRIGDDAQRAEARALLVDHLNDIGTQTQLARWQTAWIQVALGRSLLMEAESASRDEAMLQLVRVAALWRTEQPYLAGLALAELAVESARRGWTASAQNLRLDLAQTYPWHPARSWLNTQLNQAQAQAQHSNQEFTTP